MSRLAYLYSRYPVVSQTFCDSEMLTLETAGFDLEIISLNRPPDSFQHERLERLKAEIHYPPPEDVLNAEVRTPGFNEKLGALISEHDAKYGQSFKAALRARNAWHFAPLLRKLGVRHVHVHFANRATHTALFLKKLGFTFSFTPHAQDFMVDLGCDDLLREMAREAEFVVAVSDYSRDLLAKICAESEAKIFRIYNGIELDDFTTARHVSGGTIRIVSVGRLIEFKGFQHLLQALKLLKARNVEIEARIIGEGPMRAALEELISAHGLATHAQLLGRRSQKQIQQELADAHMFVLPAIVDQKGASDMLPTVITEAMACGLPVVSTTVAGIPEMVLHGKTGLLVEPGDEHALANAIMELALDPSRRKAFGEAGRRRAEALFALNKTARCLGDKFRSVVNARPALQASVTLRREAPIVYLMNSYYGMETYLQQFHDEPRLRILACSLSQKHGQLDASALTQIEFLPDASVMESHWLRHVAKRFQLEKLRKILGEAVDGEDFYLQARRSVYLGDVLQRRGVRHVHALHSDAVLCVWFLKKLTGLQVSATIEASPLIKRATLAKLLDDFDLVNNSDEKRAGETELLQRGAILQCNSPTRRQFRFGAFRLNLSTPSVVQNRSNLVREWFEKIVHNLHV